MLLYKLGDRMATALATPFYLDLGFSKTEIGPVAKVADVASSDIAPSNAGSTSLKARGKLSA